MTKQKAPRIAEMANKVCLNGHTGDWVARNEATRSSAYYCASCARESLERHKAKRLGIGSEYVARTRVRTPFILSKKQAEENWAKSVLATVPTQIAQAQTRIKELSEMIQEAHDVVQKSENDELITFAFEQLKELSKVFDKATK